MENTDFLKGHGKRYLWRGGDGEIDGQLEKKKLGVGSGGEGESLSIFFRF